MSAQPRPLQLHEPPAPDAADELRVRFAPLAEPLLDAVLAVEHLAYTHPWTRGNFRDALAAGYCTQALVSEQDVLGYFVAMQGVDEVHLLNITVAPAYQQQGWARVLLDALALWARGQQAQWLWLEVRVSNVRARQIYSHYGFQQVGLRRRYYPSDGPEREDAIVMSLQL